MNSRLPGYGRRYTMPRTCDCPKSKYRTEQQALRSADRAAADLGIPFSVYKCPGHQVWHKATRGFSVNSLKTRPRILAWHITRRPGGAGIKWLYAQLGFETREERASSKGRTVGRALTAFARLDLIRFDDPQPGFVRAVDPEDLQRVMQVGLSEYARDRQQAPGR